MLLVGTLAAATPVAHRAELEASWRTYVAEYVSSDGRVMDPSADSITTSEGQAYGMVRAVWANDAPTFERLRQWTRDNLQSGDPTALPAWRWGRRGDGTWGILDSSPAADADQLIAWALLAAGERWGDKGHHQQAIGLLHQIWDQEVAQVGKRRVMLPGAWAANQSPIIVNPSYFLPFAWRVFARVDRVHPWASLVNDGYAVWTESLSPTGLPPDWTWLDPTTGAVTAPPPGEEGRRTFGFEAFRVLWTLAADARWYGDPRAHALLRRADPLIADWKADGVLPARISWGGTPAVDWSFLGMYGALLPAWALSAPDDAQRLYDTVIAPARDRSEEHHV